MIVLFVLALLGSYVCNEEELIISISCTELVVKAPKGGDNWKLMSSLKYCPKNDSDVLRICHQVFTDNTLNYVFPITIPDEVQLCSGAEVRCDREISRGSKLYRCLRLTPPKRALVVREECEFRHTIKQAAQSECMDGLQWSEKAQKKCNASDLRLQQLAGIFPCPTPTLSLQTQFKAVQFVCCPHFDVVQSYLGHLDNDLGSIRAELAAYVKAKKELRHRFSRRQRQIRVRYASEERAISIWPQQPLMANRLEKRVQQTFRKKFIIEMSNEMEQLKNLEHLHENRMQKLYETERIKSRKRLEYVIQETMPQPSRISKALQMELESILNEAENIVEFFDTLLMEGINETISNRELVQENFVSLLNTSWNNVISILNGVAKYKKQILATIDSHEARRLSLFKKFDNVVHKQPFRDSIKFQSDNYIQSMISLYGHRNYDIGKYEVTPEAASHQGQHNRTLIIGLCTVLTVFVLTVLTGLLLLCRYSSRINVYLSSTFKKLQQPSSKSTGPQTSSSHHHHRHHGRRLLLAMPEPSGLSSSNHNNHIYQPTAAAATAVASSSSSLVVMEPLVSKFPLLSVGQEMEILPSDSDYTATGTGNINGLENPICRLLDEK